MQRSEAIHHSELEITLPTDLQQMARPRISFQDKYYHSGPHQLPVDFHSGPLQLPVEYPGQRYNSEQSSLSIEADQRRWCNKPAFGLPTLFVAMCLAAALGGGLGGGLAAHRKSSPAKENSCTKGSINNTLTLLPAYTTLPGRTALPTSPTSASSTQTSFVACPSPGADGAVYTATNRPLPFLPGLQTNLTSLHFSIKCNTNWIPDSGDSVLQTQGDINSLQECINACATYTWLVDIKNPGLECSGVEWANGRVGDLSQWQNVCFLKANLTQPCANVTSQLPGYDGAVLLYT